MSALYQRAPLDLRVNSLKASRQAAQAALAQEGLEALPCGYAPTGLRLAPGTSVARTSTYLDGLVEIQDEGSQLVSLLAGAEPGMTVIDLAAGAGGKSLALAAAMGNRDESSRPISTPNGCRVFRPEPLAPGRASSSTGRSGLGRTAKTRTSRICRAAPISWSSTRRAPARARGGASPRPSGASARQGSRL